ncbi:MAG: hypothetical protein PHY40_01775 [Patescibacteria group bacterium]|nr:hypothetical protein [Patescibacteria group bacterium]
MEEKTLPTRHEIFTEILKKTIQSADGITANQFICYVGSKLSMEVDDLSSILKNDLWEIICEEIDAEEDDFVYKFIGTRKNKYQTEAVSRSGIKIKKIILK